jgi:S-adenosylmethionine hydrolase
MAGKSTPIITLTTDFGLRDPYVAEMKGVIYSAGRDLSVVDLTHEIAAQDLFEGSLFLAGAMPHFPEGTLHVAVVDPGVGTLRHPIAVRAGGQVLLCPDNGLPTMFLCEHRLEEARIITDRRFMRETISATFHGRDIFAAAAAQLALGASFRDLGEELDTIVSLDVPRPQAESAQRVQGQIVHVDRFGNLITNIHHSLLRGGSPSLIRAGSYRLRGIHRTYAEVPAGTSLALFGSSGYLEIAVNGGDASAALRLRRGDAVSVTLGHA